MEKPYEDIGCRHYLEIQANTVEKLLQIIRRSSR